MGAGAFHGRVRNGIGCGRPARTTRSAKGNDAPRLGLGGQGRAALSGWAGVEKLVFRVRALVRERSSREALVPFASGASSVGGAALGMGE